MFERPDFGRDAGDRPKRSGSAQIISRAIIGDQFGQQVFGHALVKELRNLSSLSPEELSL